MRGLIRNARLGCITVIIFLSLRTVTLLLSLSGDDDDFLQGAERARPAGSSRVPPPTSATDVLLQVIESFPCNANVSRPRDNSRERVRQQDVEKNAPITDGYYEQEVHRRHEYWQLFDLDTSRNELLVYSAFYDDRPDVGNVPVIRILGVANTEHDQFYCQVWYADLEGIPHIVKAEEVKNGRGDQFGKITYGQYMYSCKLPPGSASNPVPPTHVSLTTQICQTSSIFLPITQSPKSSRWTEEFAICVPIAFGNNIVPASLIEWMELMRLLGVSSVHVYNATLSYTLNQVFNYYKDQGLLHVHSMPPAVVDAYNVRGAKLGSPASLNDCMLRYMHRYRYIIFIDFDEIIVPKINQNYTQMLRDIKRYHRLKSDAISYTFRNVYYFLDMPGDSAEKDYHPMLKYRKHIEPSGYLYAAKSFIDPRHCLSVFNHYCYIRFPSAGKHWTIDVATALATSHHYRKCNLGKDKCNAMFKKSATDTVMLRYKDMLHDASKRVLSIIN